MAATALSDTLSDVLLGQKPLDKILQKNPDDVVITLAIRTPLCRGHKGGMRETPLDLMIYKLLREVIQRSNIDPAIVEDICLGNVREGAAARFCRAAALAAGFPNTTSASSTSRFCASGLTATSGIAHQISTGSIDIGLAVGAETATFAGSRLDRDFYPEISEASQEAQDIVLAMGITSENVAADFVISRRQHDEFAYESYRRAEVAQKRGWFDDEIVPITVKLDGRDVMLTRDEGPRWGTTLEGLGELRWSFVKDGKSTAGNSSQVTDGAAAVLLMKRSKALELNQPILGKFVISTVVGLAPRIMGIGPTIAIPKLLTKLEIGLDDIGVIEINEAFASMAVYCRDELKLDWGKLNPRGGAIALGHPFGCTGVRQIITGLSECRRRHEKILLTSMCMGTGMGMAALFVNEQA